MKRPNLLFVYTDEQAWGTLACYGNDRIEMPNLNTLAAKVSIPETDIGKIKIGQLAIVTVDALPGKLFPSVEAALSRRGQQAAQRHSQGKQEHGGNGPLD